MKELTPYLNFDGNTLEAMTFYSKCLKAELSSMPFPNNPDGTPSTRTMHARLTKGTPILMASDTQPGMPFQPPSSFSIAIACESMDEIQQLFAELGDGGSVTMPLQDTFWEAHFGMLKDRYGVHWMLNFDKPK